MKTLHAISLFVLLSCSGLLLGQDMANLDDIPDQIEIGALENIFKPVQFDHKLHAQMTTMGAGCATCHHYAEDEVYEPCADCHLEDEASSSMSMPTLNGAYHRNCLNCHQGWRGDHVCETCHEQQKWRFNTRRQLDDTDILAHKHEAIIVPKQFHFVNPASKQKPVLFHHNEHVELYRYKCEHCHRQTDCSACHQNTPPPEDQTMTLSIHHNPCSNCHDTENETTCSNCHRDKPSPGFSHDLTGWTLNRFHAPLGCESCHTGSAPITALDNSCSACHDNFEVGSFDHAVTGVELNDEHAELDCYECHTQEAYIEAPSCSECHDEDIFFPEYVPGTLLKKQ